MRWMVVIFVLAFCSAKPQAAEPATKPTITEQSPLSTPVAQKKRYNLGIDEKQAYKTADESFEIYVPESKPDESLGIIVWVSAMNRGGMPKDWQPLMDKHRLIFVGANNAGNQRAIGVRIGLAIDAVYNLKKQFKIDDKRVYVSGISGGAKMAALMGVAYPDVFTGAFPICGVVYFRTIPLSSDATHAWPAGYARPPANLYDQARKTSRYVLITGEKDMNRDSTKDTCEGMKKDRFIHVEYVEVPGMGHTIPSAEWIDRAIESLDKPLKEKKPGK